MEALEGWKWVFFVLANKGEPCCCWNSCGFSSLFSWLVSFHFKDGNHFGNPTKNVDREVALVSTVHFIFEWSVQQGIADCRLKVQIQHMAMDQARECGNWHFRIYGRLMYEYEAANRKRTHLSPYISVDALVQTQTVFFSGWTTRNDSTRNSTSSPSGKSK